MSASKPIFGSANSSISQGVDSTVLDRQVVSLLRAELREERTLLVKVLDERAEAAIGRPNTQSGSFDADWEAHKSQWSAV